MGRFAASFELYQAPKVSQGKRRACALLFLNPREAAYLSAFLFFFSPSYYTIEGLIWLSGVINSLPRLFRANTTETTCPRDTTGSWLVRLILESLGEASLALFNE